MPQVLGKFPSSVGRPNDPLLLPSIHVDAEVEIVAVVGTPGSAIPSGHGLDHIAGLVVGQDFSERRVQVKGESPSLAKSLPGFTRIGPALTTVDELDDADDVVFSCMINGTVVQADSTASMAFSIGELVEYISRFCALQPGDLIFTGTPAGVGAGQTPPGYLSLAMW